MSVRKRGNCEDYQLDLDTDDYPVVMPEGELDIIPFQKGKISMGATHENEMGFDLTVDQALLNQMETEALAYYPELAQAEVIGERVGTRAYTSDFSPFWELFLIKQASMSPVDLVRLASQLVPSLGGT